MATASDGILQGGYDFYVRHLDRSGVSKNPAIVDFLRLRYRNVVNEAGIFEMVLPEDHPAISDFENFDQVEVYWKNDSLQVPWHRDFVGLFRNPTYETDEDGLNIYTATGEQIKAMLSYRVIAFPAGESNLTRFVAVAAETIMKRLVQYNATSDATTGNGRHRAGDLATGMGWSITIATDQGRGDTITHSYNNATLLRALTELAQIAGGDFDLVKTGDAAFTFEFYPGQVGDDKTTGADRVEFSLARGNLLKPSLTINNMGSKTVAIVGGQGRGSERNYQIIQGPAYDTDNDIEMFLSMTNEPDAAGLQSAGSARLEELRAVRDLTFDVLQTRSVFYSRQAVTGRKTYKEGDLVSVLYNDDVIDRQIKAAEVIVTKANRENNVLINIETECLSSGCTVE